MVDWREVNGQFGVMYFVNKDDFLKAKESEIPTEIKRSYENYVNTKKPENLPKKVDKNGNERYQPEWVIDDTTAGWRYKATYDDRYSWGVMRTEIKKKPVEAGGGTQGTLAGSNVEAELKTMNARLKDQQDLLEESRDLLKIIAGFFVEKGMTTADKIKKDKEQENEQSKADAALAAAAEEDDEVGNEGF